MIETVHLAHRQNFTSNRATTDDVNLFVFRAFCERHQCVSPVSCLSVRNPTMTAKTIATIGFVLFSIATLSACGNTIRGMGHDTANAVDATQDAGRSVERAAN